MKFFTTILALCFLVNALPAVADEAASDPNAGASAAQDESTTPAKEPPTTYLPYARRSPWLAGALSLVAPGAGQMYNENFVVGGIWLASEIALYMGAFGYAGAFSPGERFNMFDRPEAISLLAFALGFHAFAILEAVFEADRMNDNLEKFTLAYDPRGGGGMSLGYRFAW